MIQQTQPTFTGSEQEAMNSYLQSGGWLTEHKKTKEFEKVVADFLGVKHCFAVPNGTAALMAAYSVIPRTKNEKYIIVPNMTMVATANAARFVGLEPHFVDVDINTGCLDTKQLENIDESIKDKVIGVAYVDFNGCSHDSAGGIHTVADICEHNGWALVEDACQAFGSYSTQGVPLGTVGDIGCFSLSPHKIITTGQGGLIVTNNATHAIALKGMKDFGREKAGVDKHISMGVNFKFTDLQAVIGLEQMKNIQWRADKKKAIYGRYYKHFEDNEKVGMLKLQDRTVPWFVGIWTLHRNAAIGALKENDIGCRPMYPVVSTQNPYSRPDLEPYPNSRFLSEHGIWLPSHLDLSNDDIDLVCKVVKEIV